jgi:hypothetical protein
MKSSRSLVHWSQKFLVLVVILALTGWVQPASVSAATEYNEKISFTDDFDGCLGERITVDGIQHIVGRFTRDASGKLHFGFSRNTRGKGLGQVTGDTYLLLDTVSRISLELTPGEPRVFTEGYRSILMHHGEALPDDDTVIHFLSRVILNANGDVTSTIEIQSVECR